MPNALRAALIVFGVLTLVLFVATFLYLHIMHQPAGSYTSDLSMSSYCDVLTLTGDGRWSQTVKSESAGPEHVKLRQATGTWSLVGSNQLTFSPGLYDDALSPPHANSIDAKFDTDGIRPELRWPLPRNPFSRTNPVMTYHKPFTGNTSCPLFQFH